MSGRKNMQLNRAGAALRYMSRAKRFLLLILLQIGLIAGYAQSKASGEITASVKKLVTQIRAGNDKQAFKQMDMPSISKFLLGDHYSGATSQQLSEFASLFENLFSRIAFPKVRNDMKELSSIIYENPEVKGNEASVASTVFIKQPLKMQEKKIRYALVKTRQGWKVKDVSVLGDSMFKNIRDDQVQPLLKDGGMENLLKEMREKSAGY